MDLKTESAASRRSFFTRSLTREVKSREHITGRYYITEAAVAESSIILPTRGKYL